jgi:hypothetical protein
VAVRDALERFSLPAFGCGFLRLGFLFFLLGRLGFLFVLLVVLLLLSQDRSRDSEHQRQNCCTDNSN